MNRLTLNSRRQQQGAVLLVALVMLLLLTLIGVASMRGTSLQENMASNLKDANVAFQAAEAGLRAGERKAEELYLTMKDKDVGYEVDGKHSSDLGLGSDKQPDYKITLLFKDEGPEIPSTGVRSLLVRVDAWGEGVTVDSSGEPNVRTQLRSMYYLSRD